MVTNVLKTVLDILLSLAELLLGAIAVVLVPVILMIFVFFLIAFFQGKRIPKRLKRTLKYAKRPNLLKTLLYDFPKRFVSDIYNRDPDAFDTYGVHMFCGEQGSGKSIAAVHFMKSCLERNPNARLASNIDLTFQDSKLTDWSDILTYNNGICGQIIFLDEVQNWFSSNESRNFPPEMLTEVTQQRKQRKIIVGTSQVFGRMSKPLREQISLLYKPLTLFGCLTFVRVYKVDLNDDGSVSKMHLRRTYWFTHTDELRNAYDTFEKVQRMSVKGFQPRSEQLSSNVEVKERVVYNYDTKK